MDVMGKYDVERFLTPPDPDLICCICQCVLHKPLESTCQHVFCKVCIQTWLVNHRSCPNCRRRLYTAGLKPVLPIVRNMINRLLIKCENIASGCTKGINLEQYASHIKECDYGLVGCLNSGCTRNILRKDMMKHEKECLYRLVKCKKGCGLPITVVAMREHSCIQELKNSMQVMEDSFNKRLKDLEDRIYRDWREVESRVFSVERELDELDYNRHNYRALEPDTRHSYSRSHSHSRSRSHSHSRSHSCSRSPSRSRSHSHSRSRSHSRSHSHSRSPAYDHDYSRSPGYDRGYRWSRSRSRSSSWNRSGRESPLATYTETEYMEDVRLYRWDDYPGESERSLDGSHRDSDDSFAERDRDPTPVPQGRRRTSSGTRTRNTDQDGEGTVTTTSATTTTSNPPSRQSANTSETNQRRNQNQGSGEPSTAGSVLESPESPPYRVNTRRSTPGVVTPLVITRRPVVTDTPASPPIEQQSGTAIVTQGTRPVPPPDDTATGSLYGVAVGETDSEDVEWQPQSGNASSDSWSTENEDVDDDDSHDLSSNESTSEQPSTSDGRRASSAGSRQARRRSKSQPSTSDKAGTSSIADAIENIQKKIKKIKQGRNETRNAVETTPRGLRRRRSSSSSSSDESSSDSEESRTTEETDRGDGRCTKRARTK